MTAGAAAVTAVLADGSALLSPADVVEVLCALERAADMLAAGGAQYCPDCLGHPAGCCDSHVDDLDESAAYRAVMARLGAGVPAAAPGDARPAEGDQAVAEVVAGALAAAEDAADRLSAIRGLLAVHDWGRDDLQYALEAVDRIASGGAS
jgi:hypothetical protein